MKAKTTRAWLWVHKWSSLVTMIFFLMLCLTGLPLIFAHEIEDWLEPHPELQEVAPDTPRPALESMVEQALGKRPAGYVVPIVMFPVDEPDVMRVGTAAALRPPAEGQLPKGYKGFAFDMRTGELTLEKTPTQSGFMHVMERLHVDMFMRLPGQLFLGFMGLVVLVAVVSGVVVYAPFMRKLDFATVRADRGPRVLWLDMHNLLGIVTVVWVLVVTFTGSLNTLHPLISAHYQANELPKLIGPYRDQPLVASEERVSLDVVMKTATEAAPDRRVASVQYPGTPFSSPQHFTAVFRGKTPVTSHLISLVLIDARTGQLKGFAPMPWYVKVLYMSKPLHFGDYGGLTLKIIWTLLTLMTIVVLGTGIYLWLRKPAGASAKVRRPKEVPA